MNNEHDKSEELFRQMADKLRGHAEPYRQGAWERFAKDSGMARRTNRTAWPYWAAAVLLVLVSVAVLLRHPTDPATEGYTEHHAGQGGQASSDVRPVEKEGTTLAAEHLMERTESTRAATAALAGAATSHPFDTRVAVDGPTADPHETFVMADTMAASQMARGTVLEVAQADERSGPPVVVSTDSLTRKSDGLAAGAPDVSPFGEAHPLKTNGYGTAERNGGAADNGSRWDLAVVVSPSLTSEKINMGGGIALAYRISDRWSIRSGVSIAEMGVGQYPAGSRQGARTATYDYPVPQSAPTVNGELTADHEYLGNSYLTSVTSSLLAMDVPLDLRYHVTERFYSSVGMSLFAVLDERRTVHYTTTTASQELNGTRYNRREFSQRVSSQPIADQRVGGFLNFSIGHRLPLSKRVSLSVEPYFKVPMGSLSKQDMNLNHGGLKLVTGF